VIIALGQAGYEDLLARELASEGLLAAERGPGWVRAAVERPNAERRMSNVERSTLKSEGDSAGTTQEKVERIDLNALAMERNEAAGPVLPDFAFAHAVLRDPVEVRGESVNALAQQLAEVFMQSLRDERVESAWPCVLAGPAEIVGLGRRITSVEKAFFDLLRKRLSRVAKLAVPGTPRGAGPARGLFVFFPDFGRAWAARDAWLGGQRRMADD
jgi:23S rRNA (cytidine2498-2'-O)-methyltransferase